MQNALGEDRDFYYRFPLQILNNRKATPMPITWHFEGFIPTMQAFPPSESGQTKCEATCDATQLM